MAAGCFRAFFDRLLFRLAIYELLCTLVVCCSLPVYLKERAI